MAIITDVNECSYEIYLTERGARLEIVPLSDNCKIKTTHIKFDNIIVKIYPIPNSPDIIEISLDLSAKLGNLATADGYATIRVDKDTLIDMASHCEQLADMVKLMEV